MASPSLNQIKNAILDFARGHGQLNCARFCQPYDLLEDGDVAYPALYFNITSARKDKNELVMNFTAYIADRVNPEKDNEPDVLSDTMLIACDLLGYLDADDRDFRLQSGTPLKPFRETDGDNIGGFTTDFVLAVPFPFNRCIIPSRSNRDFIETEDGFTIITEAGEGITTE